MLDPLHAAQLRRHVRVGEWAILAFLFLALLSFGYVGYFWLTNTGQFPAEGWWMVGARVALFLALYYYARRRGAAAFRAAAVVMLVMSLSLLFVGNYLLSLSYLIGTYLQWRAGKAARQLYRNGRFPEDDSDILDADMTR